MQGGFDQEGYISRVMAINPMEGLKLKQQLAKQATKYSSDVKTGVGPDGKTFTYVMGEDGSQKRLDGTMPRDEMKLAELGGTVEAYNPYALTPGQKFTKTLTTGDRVSMRGQDKTDLRSRELNDIHRQGQRTQIISDPIQGPLLIDKGTGQARQAIGADGNPIRGEQTIKKESQAKGLLPVIDSAEKLLGGATGSYAGAGVDKTAQFFGVATGGAKNIAQLKVLEGQIMMNQPRMEGPQSNMDVLLYRQMAGQIGDSTVPQEMKRAAIKSIREIHQRYAGSQQEQSRPARKSVLKGQVIDGYRFKGGDPANQNNWEQK